MKECNLWAEIDIGVHKQFLYKYFQLMYLYASGSVSAGNCITEELVTEYRHTGIKMISPATFESNINAGGIASRKLFFPHPVLPTVKGLIKNKNYVHN